MIPKQKLSIPLDKKPLSFHEWRDMEERSKDVMPLRYWREAEKMYEEYLSHWNKVETTRRLNNV